MRRFVNVILHDFIMILRQNCIVFLTEIHYNKDIKTECIAPRKADPFLLGTGDMQTGERGKYYETCNQKADRQPVFRCSVDSSRNAFPGKSIHCNGSIKHHCQRHFLERHKRQFHLFAGRRRIPIRRYLLLVRCPLFRRGNLREKSIWQKQRHGIQIRHLLFLKGSGQLEI